MTNHLSRRTRALLEVAAACTGLALFATGCSLSLGSSPITEPDDVRAGECLTIDGSSGPGKVDASTSDCDVEGKLTFYAAETVPMSGSCSGSNSAHISFTGKKLCITPNFVPSNCYQIPIPGGQLVDYRRVNCSAEAASNTVVATLETRGTAEIACADDQTKWKFAQPTSIGYCLKEVSV